MPARPLATCWDVVPRACGWNHSVHAAWLISNDGEYVPPGSMVFCGPPSTEGGTCAPCQCTVLTASRLLVMSIRTVSPWLTLRTGPRNAWLKPQVALLI